MTLKQILKRLHLSWFDVLILICGFSLLATFYLFFRRESANITIRVKVTDQTVLIAKNQPFSWYASHFQVGDSETDALGRKITEILSVQTLPTSPTARAVYLDLKVGATFDPKSKTYTARGRNLAFGTPLRFSLAGVTFDGIVVNFPGMVSTDKEKTLIVSAVGRSVEAFIAQGIHTGDTLTDSNGKVLIEVLDVQTPPAEKVATNFAGELLLRRDPLYKDLQIKMKVTAKELNGVFYALDDSPIKVAEILPLNFNTVSLFPSVSKIEVVE
jgi:hypothetical protein